MTPRPPRINTSTGTADERPGCFRRAFNLPSTAGAQALYADWADSYDAELAENGYCTPQRCAAALATLTDDLDAPLLDIGCGTGLSGEAYAAAGFTIIDGSDMSRDMLARMGARRQFYRDVHLTSPEAPFPGLPGVYRHITAVGALSADQAPPSLIDVVVERLPVGGFFVFFLNDNTLERDPEYLGRVKALAFAGRAVIAFREHGPHLPRQDFGALVVALCRQ